jgi:outer membrane lipoprotein-sorting protein
MHIKYYIAFFIFLACGSSYAQQVPASPVIDVPAFKAKLEAMSQNVNTIESDFVQEKNLSVLANTIVSKGHFIFKKENNIRWEYLLPYKYLIIISNNKIFVKEEQNQKQYDIQSNKMFQEMNKFISGCIQGDILKNDKDFRVGYFEDDKSFFVSLMPKSEAMRKMLNEVQIWFAKSDLTVTRIRMVESGGDYTKIDFTNKKINTEVPVEKFSFK